MGLQENSNAEFIIFSLLRAMAYITVSPWYACLKTVNILRRQFCQEEGIKLYLTLNQRKSKDCFPFTSKKCCYMCVSISVYMSIWLVLFKCFEENKEQRSSLPPGDNSPKRY